MTKAVLFEQFAQFPAGESDREVINFFDPLTELSDEPLVVSSPPTPSKKRPIGKIFTLEELEYPDGKKSPVAATIIQFSELSEEEEEQDPLFFYADSPVASPTQPPNQECLSESQLGSIERADTEEPTAETPRFLSLRIPSETLELYAPCLAYPEESISLMPDVLRNHLPINLQPWLFMSPVVGHVSINWELFERTQHLVRDHLPLQAARRVTAAYHEALVKCGCEKLYRGEVTDLWQSHRLHGVTEFLTGCCDLCELSFLEIVQRDSIAPTDFHVFVVRSAACIGRKPSPISLLIGYIHAHEGIAKLRARTNAYDRLFVSCPGCFHENFAVCDSCVADKDYFAQGPSLCHLSKPVKD